ncbi:pyruvate formate lyase family protein [Chloroflexota bacterium]
MAETWQSIDSINVMNDRLNAIRQRYFDSGIHICAERAHLATESWKETEGDHIYIRRAELFAKICDEIPVSIKEHELIVGSQTPFVRGASPQLDFHPRRGLEFEAGDRRTRGEQTSGVVTEDDLKTIIEDSHFWKGRSPGERISAAMREVVGTTVSEMQKGIFNAEWGAGAQWRRSADYGKVLRHGLRGVIAEIEKEKEKLQFTSVGDENRWYFLKAAKICCEAMVRYAKRYAELARQLAAAEADKNRKEELETIAEICKRVPENPARSFWEALQSVRFICLGLNLEQGSRNESTGRMDQYLYPYYKSDIERGKLTRQQAAELLGCLWMKFAEMEIVSPSTRRMEGNHGNKVTLGGVDRQGEDATNELTYMILHVVGQTKMAEPAPQLRCHSGTPRELMLKAAWTNLQTGAHPAFLNDGQIIPGLLSDGASLEDARDYYLLGCVHPFPWGATSGNVFLINGGKVFELVMYNGFDPRTGKKLGIETGDPRTFRSIDDWISAFTKQWEYVSSIALRANNAGFRILAEHYAVPFMSSLQPDCLQKGLDILRGGARYPQFTGEIFNRLYADIADSLMAIKKLVYDDQIISVDELIEACANNFEGESGERIRDMLLMAPKYGNDLGEPEEIYRQLNDSVSEITRSLTGHFGYAKRDTRNGADSHVAHGKVTSALPNGRKAGMPLADGAISPVAGCDTKGPTATLRSAAKAVNWKTIRSAILNQKMPKTLLKTTDQLNHFVDLIETYFQDYNGYQIQWNIEDAEVYQAAKVNPSAYKDLIVRVGGYSAYFIELDPILQDQIIARTEQWV